MPQRGMNMSKIPSAMATYFAIDKIEYPAFVVVYERSKHGITSHNRSEWDEHFACDYCLNADQCERLFEGTQGSRHGVSVYVATSPAKVQEVLAESGIVTSYDSSDNDDD
jgi:hypothetical protein